MPLAFQARVIKLLVGGDVIEGAKEGGQYLQDHRLNGGLKLVTGDGVDEKLRRGGSGSRFGSSSPRVRETTGWRGDCGNTRIVGAGFGVCWRSGLGWRYRFRFSDGEFRTAPVGGPMFSPIVGARRGAVLLVLRFAFNGDMCTTAESADK